MRTAWSSLRAPHRHSAHRHFMQRHSGTFGVAALGFAAGVAAMLGRKIVVQAISTGAAKDWADGLVHEHEAALKIFDKLEQTDESQSVKRTMLLKSLAHALAKHAFQEETVIYPALREHGMTEAADGLNHEHGYVKQYLYTLDNMSPDSAGWLGVVRDFRADIEKHMRAEETDLFIRLRQQLSTEQNRALTRKMHLHGLMLA